MQSDLELLELAAKAAGFGDPEKGRVCWTESEYPSKSGKYGALWNYVGHMDTAELWNPLTDDGDALRLAVKLQIQVTPGTYNKDEFTAYNSFRHAEAHEYLSFQQDEYAATRRAIVRAAAAMVKENGDGH